MPIKLNSVIGLHVEPSPLAAMEFEEILTQVAIALVKARLMNLTLEQSAPVVDRLQPFIEADNSAETEVQQLARLSAMLLQGRAVSECFKEFRRYASGSNAARLFVKDPQPAVNLVREKLAELGALDRAEIAVIDLTDFASLTSLQTWQFVTVHPENFPLSFKRHIPELQQ